MKTKSVILIGMAGVGKSTCGRILAQILAFDFIDLDLLISEKAEKDISRIIKDQGEEDLLKIEKQAMQSLDPSQSVIAPGGSIIYHSDLMQELKNKAALVYLKDDLERIASRMKDYNKARLIGIKSKSLEELFQEREPLYMEFSDMMVNVSGKTPQQIAEEIYQSL